MLAGLGQGSNEVKVVISTIHLIGQTWIVQLLAEHRLDDVQRSIAYDGYLQFYLQGLIQ